MVRRSGNERRKDFHTREEFDKVLAYIRKRDLNLWERLTNNFYESPSTRDIRKGIRSVFLFQKEVKS